VLTNYDQDMNRKPYVTEAHVRISDVMDCPYGCTRHWAADRQHGNSYGKWIGTVRFLKLKPDKGEAKR